MDAFYFDSRRPLCKEDISLQKLIIRVIAENFTRYLQEYYSPNSRIPKYFFAFLQKQYSQELFFSLMDYGLLKVEFLDFVFNIHLKEVYLKSGLKQKKLEFIKHKIINIGESITTLSMMGDVNFHLLHPVLSFLPYVKKLELEYCSCDDSSLEVIANHCPLLTHLNVYASLVSDDGMKYLCFPEKHKLNLELLTVSRTQVKKSGVLMILKNMPSIQILSYENLSCTISSAFTNNEFPRNHILNLTSIEILHPKTELEPISQLCPYAKHLFVKNIECPKQLLNCHKFKTLKEVCLSYETRTGCSLCIDEFLKVCGSEIRSLSLENFTMSTSVLLQSCPNLEVLKLYDPSFSELLAAWNVPRLKLQKLAHFKIFGCSLLSDEEVKSPAFILESSPNLESLSLQCCFIGPIMENVILNCHRTLIQLDFTESLVCLNFLQEIVLKHKVLQWLIVENSGIHMNDYHNLLDIIAHIDHPVTVFWC